MLFRTKQTPLMACEVIHSLPGRVRVGCRALRYLGAEAKAIEGRLQRHHAVKKANITVITANVVVLYDANVLTGEDVREYVDSVLSHYTAQAHRVERQLETMPTVNERRLQEEPLSAMVTRVVTTAAALGFSLFRIGARQAPATFWGRFMTMPALTALSLGWPIFKSGFNSLRTSYRPNADTLSATAIISSLIAGRDISALTVIWLADIAELLTAYTMSRTRRAINEMLNVGDEFAWRLAGDGREERVPLITINPEDLVVVPTGDRISVDGVVEEGEAAVDQATITGEFMPMQKIPGDQVYAGTVVKTGRIVVRAKRVGDDTQVARIVHLVEEALHRKASFQAFADRFSAQFIPMNFALAALVYAVTRNPSRALNMLIIDYSCGVRLSTATAFSAAICNAARNGVLIKGGNFIELMAEADTVVLDKTGTLTEGRAEVVTAKPVNGEVTPRELIEYAAAAEETSTHPMAVAVLEKVRRSGWQIPKHTQTQVHVARGVETKVGRTIVRVGNKRFMTDSGIDVSAVETMVADVMRQGENVIYVSKGKALLGILGIQDVVRENMKKAVNRLRFLGMDDIILLTGDVEQHAEHVAHRMGLDSHKGEVLPEDKADTVLQLQSKGVRVVMVGDGINDAPALAYADVGIAMGGTRTDVAIEAADVSIASDNPLMIPAAMRLASKTMAVVKENFAIAIGVNTVALVLASLGVLPVFWGAVVHNSCTVAVVLNSTRLLLHDIEKSK